MRRFVSVLLCLVTVEIAGAQMPPQGSTDPAAPAQISQLNPSQIAPIPTPSPSKLPLPAYALTAAPGALSRAKAAQGGGAAQNQDAELKVPSLEVVSVKQTKGKYAMSTMGVTADGLVVMNTPLIFIIQTAYAGHFSNGTIVGIPSWEMDRYDIVGKVSDADLDKMRNLSQPQRVQMTRAMLQMVLANRFQMKVHDDDREGPVYNLVVSKNGSLLKEATPDEVATGEKRMDQRGTIKGPLSLKELAGALTGPITGRVVIDKTGLLGEYDITLTWTPDQGGPPPRSNEASSMDAAGPSIFTAVQEQLGLKLESAKGPVKSLVIEHIERPSEN